MDKEELKEAVLNSDLHEEVQAELIAILDDFNWGREALGFTIYTKSGEPIAVIFGLEEFGCSGEQQEAGMTALMELFKGTNNAEVWYRIEEDAPRAAKEACSMYLVPP